MAQNEMKAKPALPERVRSMEGLGGADGTAALTLAAETPAELERRDTFCLGVVIIAGSVPEPSPIRHRLGAVLSRWRAARRRTGSHHKAHALAVNRAKDGSANRGGGSMQQGPSGAKFGGEQRTSGVNQRYSPWRERRLNRGFAPACVFCAGDT